MGDGDGDGGGGAVEENGEAGEELLEVVQAGGGGEGVCYSRDWGLWGFGLGLIGVAIRGEDGVEDHGWVGLWRGAEVEEDRGRALRRAEEG